MTKYLQKITRKDSTMSLDENTQGDTFMDQHIAQRLADLRRQHKLSQEALAEKLGLSRQAVSKWERGESSPDTDNLIALAKIYNMSLDELLNNPVSKEETKEASCVKENENAEDKTTSDEPNSEKQKPFFKDGNLCIDDGKSSVQIGKNGIHVNEYGKTQGNEVHIDLKGIHVREGKEHGHKVDVDSRGIYIDDCKQDKYNNFKKHWIKQLPVFFILLVAWLLVGFFTGAWWTVIFFIIGCGLWESVTNIIDDHKKPKKVWTQNVPIFWIVLLVFFYLGFFYSAWHPGWIVFLLIPIWEGITSALKERKKQKDIS